MRYYLTKMSIDFPYGGVTMRALTLPGVPAELNESDPPPPVEADGNTQHVHFWSPADYRWDEQESLAAMRDLIERQGHSVSDIRLAVVRTSGEPSEQQQRWEELAVLHRMRMAGGGVDTELD